MGCEYTVCEDRGAAIREAILKHGEDEKVVLLLGKGREARVKRGLGYVDTPSDVEYALRYLKQYDELTLTKRT
jgi:hypothetical protein